MILVFGSINVDLIVAVERLPRPGETVVGPSYRLAPGGKGANQAAAAAKAGARVHMVARVGRDSFAELAIAALNEAGVDTRGIDRSQEPTGCALVCVDAKGQNQIAVASGANRTLEAGQAQDRWLGPGTTVLLQMEVSPDQNWALARRARAHGARVVLNLAPAQAVPSEALAQVDVLVLNEVEAVALAEAFSLRTAEPAEAGRRIARALGLVTVVSLGACGAALFAAEEAFEVGALALKPVDTTGAGDAFVGVLAAALDRGAPLEAALRRASVAGSLACLKAGAMPSLPGAREIEGRLGDLPPPRRI